MENKKKIIVAHPMQQHSYFTATALSNEGMLLAYATTVYYDEKRLVYKLLRKFIGENNIKRMCAKAITDPSVKIVQFCELTGLFYLLLLRIDRKKRLLPLVWKNLCRRFGKKLYKYAKKNGADAVFMYDTTAAPCFEKIKKSGIKTKCILDSTSIPQADICRIIEGEQKKNYSFQHSLNMRLKSAKKNLKANQKELVLADAVFAGSTHCAKLVENARGGDKSVFVVPYGVNVDAFTKKDYAEQAPEVVNFLFVGGLEATKGSYYILEAFKSLDRSDAKLVCVGDCGYAKDELDKYQNVEFKGFVYSGDMPETYKKADVYVIPSLYEGLSRSLIEAMSSGLPAIATTMSGALDCIEDGVCGFRVEPADIESLKEKVIYFCENKEQIKLMGERACGQVKGFTWENYGVKLVEKIKGILDNEA